MHQSGVKIQRVKLQRRDCNTRQHKTTDFSDCRHLSFRTHSTTLSDAFLWCLVWWLQCVSNLVCAPVLHTEAYRHHLETGMIDELLRHSPERAPSEPSPCASCQARRHPKTMWCISHRARFFPRTRGSEPKLEGGTFSSALIPSPAMDCQLLSQPKLHRNQSLVYFIPKPGLSNLAHFITSVIRPLLPHRTTCPVPSRFTPTPDPVQCLLLRLSSWASRDQHVSTSCPGNFCCLSPQLATAACGEG